jgi:hypothetical protein
MPQSEFVAVKCKLSKGIFSTERAFEITLANGEVYSGPAPIHFCWNAAGKLLVRGEAEKEEIDGWVAARPLKAPLPEGQVGVKVPDGTSVAVRKSQVHSPWTDILPPTPTSS